MPSGGKVDTSDSKRKEKTMADHHARAEWSGNLSEGSGTVHLASGAAGPLEVDWKTRTEEPGGATSPEELIAGAHAACFSMALSNGLAQGGNAPDKLTTNATASIEKTAEGFRITRILLEVTGEVEGIDQATFEQAAAAAKVGCPVSNALTGVPQIEVKASLE
jgi:lipoyl-dependent peroxiredoxin